MTPARVAIDGIDGGPERLRSYSGLQEDCAWVLYPDREEQLAQIFAYAHENDRLVTFRAGGRSFDGQSLGNDIVVSMDRFDAITVGDTTATVGAGATWGRILRKLVASGRMPAVTVTTELATAGGTLSGNCLSRFSAAYGKEGTRVSSFTLMTPDGQIRECARPADGATTLEERLFLATIGGLGYLGAVLSITYDVLPLPKDAPPTVVETEVVRLPDLATYVDCLVESVRKRNAEQSTPQNPCLIDAVYSAICLRAGSYAWPFLFHSTLKGNVRGRPLLVFEPQHWLRVPLELAFRWRRLNTFLWWWNFHVFHRRPKRFVNGLASFTFFMDGNGRAKRFAAGLGINLKTIQQTFVIPSDFSSSESIQATKDRLHAWLTGAAQVLRNHGVEPTFQDVLWLPHDLAFPLSTTATSGGFAVSYAIETNSRSRIEAAVAALKELSAKVAAPECNGRVYLVKNVYAAPETIVAMYGTGIEEFRALKAEVDPGGVLHNQFFADKLGAAVA